MRAICTSGWPRTLRTKPYKTPLDVLLSRTLALTVGSRLHRHCRESDPNSYSHNAEKATPLRGFTKHYEQLSATGAGLPFVVFARL